MNCPDCGSKLTDVASPAGVIMRCFKCGGFWLDGETANKLKSAELATWRRISVSQTYLSGGKGVCPADGSILTKYDGEQVPINTIVQRCERCGKWWFPGDSMFTFKPAVEAKTMYFRLWGLPFKPTAVMLPLLLVSVLLGGAAVGVSLVQREQRPVTEAAAEISEFSGNYLGKGEAIIVFRSKNEVGGVEYKEAGKTEWRAIDAERVNDYKIVYLSGLSEGGVYEVRIAGEIWGFVAR